MRACVHMYMCVHKPGAQGRGRGKEREKILSRIHAQQRALGGTWSQDPEMTTWMLKWLSHLGTPPMLNLHRKTKIQE